MTAPRDDYLDSYNAPHSEPAERSSHYIHGLIPTEQLNPNTRSIDLLATRHILEKINDEDRWVPDAVRRAIPEITRLVDGTVDRLRQGGHLYYVGAGTSGRLGVLDAAECPPTFGVPTDLVKGIIAGGHQALIHAVEGAEDNYDAGQAAIEELTITSHDVVVGLSASGGAPYVLGAITEAKRRGALTGAITCVPECKLVEAADIPMVAVVGPEVLAGSTRMKAGTAQKLILNMISTATMVQLGKTYENWMVDVQPTNQKLRGRAVRIVATLGQVSEFRAQEALEHTGYQVKPAIAMLRLGLSYEEACRRLEATSGKLRALLEEGDPQTELETETQPDYWRQ